MKRKYFAAEEELGKAYDLRLIFRFLAHLRPHWGPLAFTLAIIFLSIGVELTAPFILRSALDGPVASGDIDALGIYGAAFLAIAILTGIFEGLKHWASNLAGQRIILDMRTETFAHLQKMPAAFYDKNPVGRLLTRVTGDIENLSELFTSGLIGMFSSIIYLAAILAVMFVLDWRLALITLASLPLVVASAAVFRRHARRTYRAARQAIAHATAYLNECLGGVKTIQIFDRAEFCGREFDSRNSEYRERSTMAAYVYSFFWPGIELISTMVVAMILWQGGKGMLAGTMTFGSFMAFWYLVRKFFEPIQELAEKYNILQAAMASSERIFKLLDTSPSIQAPAEPISPPRRGSVAFENVSFSYDGKTPVLKNVSFRVEPGETVALVGYTGAGKTSILSLLLRLYEVDSGRILVDGVDVRDYDPQDLRRRFGMVFQDVLLFSGTVAENIRLGDEIPFERLERVARLVNAQRIIDRLPEGWRSDLHERGSAVSTGERQLLSFARALVWDPPILVLDEATSSVDAETEGLIQDAVSKSQAGRTAIIVAHRLSTIERSDRILVLHHGELREEGTHEELLKKSGLYEKLHRLQWQTDRR